MNVELEVKMLAESLLHELGSDTDNYQFFIPDWEPQDCTMAIRWLKSHIWEGFKVSFEVDSAESKVYVKSWEEDFE
ncbi:hypothetical protein L4C34_17740 [Vibrio profundum]|uniref:hypothetical protein n=1 Tax=Vibrio profundum TaxID=2910247 RepID=UPI003D0D2D1D